MKPKNAIQLSDISILKTIFFPKLDQIIVFDPQKKVQKTGKSKISFATEEHELISIFNSTSSKFIFFNLSKFDFSNFINHPFLTGMIDFSKSDNSRFTTFFFINNPDQTMRWVFPKKSKSPSFLHLYNSSGWKGSLFKNTTKVLHSLGWMQPITSGEFSIFFKNKELFFEHFGDLKFDDYAIFTGTVGADRKGIIALSSMKKCNYFVKIPINQSANQLVNNEYDQLNKLASPNFEYLKIPQTIKTPSSLIVSNVKPEKYLKNISFGEIHLKALDELYDNSLNEKKISSTTCWATIQQGLDILDQANETTNGLEIKTIKELRNLCYQLFFDLDHTMNIKTATGHGDFTPWNMYIDDSKLYVYDWEMSQSDMPLLFDVFHYFFQKGILVDRKSAQHIFNEIEEMMNSDEGKKMLKSYNLDWQYYYWVYILYIVCKYLPKYLRQQQLHVQVHWLVATWKKSLSSYSPKAISV